MQQRARRAVRAAELQAACRQASRSARGDAINASTIARVGVDPSFAAAVAGSPCLQLLAATHAAETGLGNAPGAPAPSAELERLLADPAIAGDPFATAVCRCNLGCAILRELERSQPTDADRAAALARAIDHFAAATAIPQGPLNRAAALLELARLEDAGRRGARLDEASAVLRDLAARPDGAGGLSRLDRHRAEGAWNAMTARQFAALTALLALERGAGAAVAADASAQVQRALEPLRPDPVVAEVDEDPSDWQCLFLDGALRNAAGDGTSRSRFEAAAGQLAALARASSAAADSKAAAAFRDLAARALLLSALCAPHPDESTARAALEQARALGAADGCWSARLLEAGSSGLLAVRAGLSVDPSTREGELRAAELELVRFVFRGDPRPPERGCLSRLPAADADVMARAVTRRAAAGGAS